LTFDETSQKIKNVETYASKSHSQENSSVTGPTYPMISKTQSSPPQILHLTNVHKVAECHPSAIDA
jgi:hypothetical protein